MTGGRTGGCTGQLTGVDKLNWPKTGAKGPKHKTKGTEMEDQNSLSWLAKALSRLTLLSELMSWQKGAEKGDSGLGFWSLSTVPRTRLRF